MCNIYYIQYTILLFGLRGPNRQIVFKNSHLVLGKIGHIDRLVQCNVTHNNV